METTGNPAATHCILRGEVTGVDLGPCLAVSWVTLLVVVRRAENPKEPQRLVAVYLTFFYFGKMLYNINGQRGQETLMCSC